EPRPLDGGHDGGDPRPGGGAVAGQLDLRRIYRTSMDAAADVLTIQRPEQLKALGHPLRLRVLEMLSKDSDEPLTNRDLAQRLGVDPGHLHFHVRMLLRAGLIELADSGRGREKPYRAAARTVRVSPELRA